MPFLMEIPRITQYNALFQGEAVCASLKAVCASCLHPRQEELAEYGTHIIIVAAAAELRKCSRTIVFLFSFDLK